METEIFYKFSQFEIMFRFLADEQVAKQQMIFDEF